MSSYAGRSPDALTRGWVARIAVALTCACALSASVATSAHATLPAPGGGGGSVRSEAVAIMKLTYKQFMWLKKNDPMPPFDWSTDGCSWTPSVKYFDLAKIFNPACQLHDFGYRNFGKGLNLGHNEKTRAWIDGRFPIDPRAQRQRDTHADTHIPPARFVGT